MKFVIFRLVSLFVFVSSLHAFAFLGAILGPILGIQSW